MTDLEELRERLRNHRPVPWAKLPDFALYMDQVLGYMDRQIIRFRDDDALTSAMVNNYTKSGLVPRAEGKKYGREHLAYLTAICVLKRVMSTRDMDLLIRQELRGRKSVEDGYAAFCDSLDKALRITLREVEQREGLSPDAAPEGEPASGGAVEAGMADTAAKVSGTVSDSTEADSPAEAGREAAGTAEGVSGTPGHSLADNAIHFALLSYAAGVASRRYVALLRKQYARPDSAPPSGKVSRKETREKAARREAKTAKREAKATDKAAKREGKTPEKDAEKDSRHTESN